MGGWSELDAIASASWMDGMGWLFLFGFCRYGFPRLRGTLSGIGYGHVLRCLHRITMTTFQYVTSLASVFSHLVQTVLRTLLSCTPTSTNANLQELRRPFLSSSKGNFQLPYSIFVRRASQLPICA